MTEEMDKFYNMPISFGKFNCVLFFESSQSRLPAIYADIINFFKPNQIEMSSFDLEKFEMSDFDVSLPFQDDNLIRKVIFVGNKEEIILEYYKGKYVIEHLHQGADEKGALILKKYIHEISHCVITLGFELSINIDSFFESLENSKNDASIHPIVVIEKNQYESERKDYASDNDELSVQKLRFITDYLQKIDLKN